MTMEVLPVPAPLDVDPHVPVEDSLPPSPSSNSLHLDSSSDGSGDVAADCLEKEIDHSIGKKPRASPDHVSEHGSSTPETHRTATNGSDRVGTNRSKLEVGQSSGTKRYTTSKKVVKYESSNESDDDAADCLEIEMVHPSGTSPRGSPDHAAKYGSSVADGSGRGAANGPELGNDSPPAADLHISSNQVEEDGSVGLSRYQPLYRATIAGDWETAEKIFDEDRGATTALISASKETALHIAALVGHAEFIKKLLQRMPLEALGWLDSFGRTALHNAAIYGSLDAVKALVNKSSGLTQVMSGAGYTPLAEAAYYHSQEVIWYLTLHTTDEPPASPFTGDKSGELIRCLTCSGLYDVCLHLLDRYPNLATARNTNGSGMLSSLAYKPSDFHSGSRLNIWERCIYHLIPVEIDHNPPRSLRSDVEDPPVLPRTSPTSRTYLARVPHQIIKAVWKVLEYTVFGVKRMKDEKYKHKCSQKLVEIACEQMSRSAMTPKEIVEYFKRPYILHIASDHGVVEIISICLRNFPHLIWIQAKYGYILQGAVRLRREKVVNLMLEKNAITKILANRVNESNQTVLHLVGKLAPYPQLSSVSCPALQMQRELQWFKVVEDFVHPLNRGLTDKASQTAHELFTSEHRELLRDAERWMKDTSNSCMVVATLIATVVFAAAFTVPGGNVDGKGIPIFLNEKVFMLFVVSDTLALFSSTTSILMFLSILTARYAEEDFLRALPKRLILGLTSLFIAIATMMVAFGATLYMVLSERFKWIFIPVIGVTSIPVALFVMLQLPLFIYILQSTYSSGIFRPKKIW